MVTTHQKWGFRDGLVAAEYLLDRCGSLDQARAELRYLRDLVEEKEVSLLIKEINSEYAPLNSCLCKRVSPLQGGGDC